MTTTAKKLTYSEYRFLFRTMGNKYGHLIKYVKKESLVYKIKFVLFNAFDSSLNNADRPQRCPRLKSLTVDWSKMIQISFDRKIQM